MKLASIIASIVMTSTHHATARNVCSNARLRVDVYHQNETSVHYQGKDDLSFSPTAFTLISSATEAVLVDAPTLPSLGTELASWITETAPGKKLKYIYVTHAHADHFNAFPAILAKYPDARVVTTKGVLAHMPGQYEEPMWSTFWKGLFPSVTKSDLSLVHELPVDGKFSLDDGKHGFHAIEVGGGDTPDSTVLHVPELALVVSGDVVYGHCYQYIAENPTAEGRKNWLQSLEEVRALKPKFVVPSHMQPDEDFGATHLDETKDYIENWEEWLSVAKSWEELEELAKEKYPERVGDFILRYTAQTFFNATF